MNTNALRFEEFKREKNYREATSYGTPGISASKQVVRGVWYIGISPFERN